MIVRTDSEYLRNDKNSLQNWIERAYLTEKISTLVESTEKKNFLKMRIYYMCVLQIYLFQKNLWYS